MSIKVLHLIDSGGLYGAEIMLLNLVEEQVKAGLKPMILSAGTPSDDEKPLEIEAKKRGLPVMPFRMKAGLNLLKGLEVVRFAKKEGYDILHSHGYKFNILLGIIPKFIRKIPTVTTIHGYVHGKKFSKMWVYQYLDMIFIKSISRIVFVNESMLNQNFFKKINIKDVAVINNGINVSREIGKIEVQKKWNAEADIQGFIESASPLLGTICRLSPGKGVQDLIDGFSLVIKKIPGARLLIVGDGDYKFELEKQINSLGLMESVKVIGFSSNIYFYLKKFDLFILPSHSEGLPMVLLEAMISKSLILATNVGGIPEVLCGGRLGGLVDPKSPVSLAIKIIEYCENGFDHESVVNIKRVIRQEVFEKYAADRMSQSYEDLYDCLRSSRSRKCA